jgi:hypothetical protein
MAKGKKKKSKIVNKSGQTKTGSKQGKRKGRK